MEKRITFTPGPWFVSLTPDRDEEGWVGPEVYDRDLGVFAVLDGEPETIAQPWSEADARLIAAAPDLLAALEDTEHVRRGAAHNREGLRFLTEELRRLGAEVPDSQANFVFADFHRPSGPLNEALLRRGVIVRPVPNYGFPNALRISVGLEAENRRLLGALREVL